LPTAIVAGLRVAPLLLLALSLAPACQLEAKLTVEHFHCDDGRCPSGQVCGTDLICYDPAELDGGLPVDGDAGPLGPCNKITLLADDFAAPVIGPQWYSWQDNAGESITRPSGRLRFTLAANQSQTAYAGYTSTRWFDLSEEAVSLHIAHMVNPASSAEAYLSIYTVAGDWLTWTQSGGDHYLDTNKLGDPRDRVVVPYDPADAYWRVRVAGGTLYFEAAPDGSSWHELDSRPLPFAMSLVRVEVAAGTWKSEPSPGYLEIEDVNGGVASGRYCKASTLHDDFDDGVRAPTWENSYEMSGCTMSETGGELVGDPPAPTGAASYCAYQSASGFDLTGSQVTLEVTEMLSAQPQTVAFFKLADELNQHGVELAVELGKLECRVWQAGVRSSLGAVTWNASAQRFWRLGEAGGTISWQASADGSSWTTLCATPTKGVDIDDVAIHIGVGTPTPTASSTVGSFRVNRLN
jgi:hypothetical protein